MLRRKIPCPYDRDELARLYDQFTSESLVDKVRQDHGLSVSRSLVLQWLRAADIPRRKYSPFTQRRVESPYSKDRLYELYWRQGLSCEEIAQIARSTMTQAVTQAIVKRWLKEAGVTLRTPHEWLVLRARKNPEKWKEHAKKHLAPAKKYKGQQIPAWARKKGVRAAARAKLARRVVRHCAYCGAEVVRAASLFRHDPWDTFCSKRCSAKAMAQRRRAGFDPHDWEEPSYLR